MIVEEKTISSERIYTGKLISLKVDTVEIENKGYQKREIVEHQGAVAIVAITDEDKVVLIKQFRKPIEQVIWEIPAGKLEMGESPKDCAIRELKEETGVKNVKILDNDIFSLEIICVKGHIKREKYVSSHVHLNLTYFLEVDETEVLQIKKDENSGVKWIDLKDIEDVSNEEWMIENVYKN